MAAGQEEEAPPPPSSSSPSTPSSPLSTSHLASLCTSSAARLSSPPVVHSSTTTLSQRLPASPSSSSSSLDSPLTSSSSESHSSPTSSVSVGASCVPPSSLHGSSSSTSLSPSSSESGVPAIGAAGFPSSLPSSSTGSSEEVPSAAAGKDTAEGAEVQPRETRKQSSETRKNEPAATGVLHPSSKAQDLSMPPPAKLPKPLLRKQRKLPGAPPAISRKACQNSSDGSSATSSSDRANSSNSSSDRVVDAGQKGSNSTGNRSVLRVSAESPASRGDKPTTAAERVAAGATRNGEASGSGLLQRQQEVRKQQQQGAGAEAPAGVGSSVKKVPAGASKKKDEGQVKPHLASAITATAAADVAADVEAQGCTVASSVGATSGQSGRLGETSNCSDSSSSVSAAEASKASESGVAAAGGGGAGGECGNEAGAAGVGGEQQRTAEEEKDVNALFESFMSEIEQLEQQNRLLLESGKPEESETGTAYGGVHTPQEYPSTEAASRRRRVQPQGPAAAASAVSAAVLPRPFLEAKPTRHAPPPAAGVPTAAAAAGKTEAATSPTVTRGNEAEPTAAAVSATAASAAPGARTPEAAVCSAVAAVTASGRKGEKRNSVTTAIPFVGGGGLLQAFPEGQVETAVAKPREGALQSSSGDGKGRCIWETRSHKETHCTPEVNGLCDREADAHAVLKEFDNFTGGSTTAAVLKGVKGPAESSAETEDADHTAAGDLARGPISDGDICLRRGAPHGVSAVDTDCGADELADGDREGSRKRLAAARPPAAAAARTGASTAAPAVAGGGATGTAEEGERGSQRRRREDGETGGSSSSGNTDGYIPVSTKSLATAEEKIAEFLQQLWLIETAVDEHEELQLQRMRQRRRQQQRRTGKRGGGVSGRKYRKQGRKECAYDGFRAEEEEGEDLLSEETETDTGVSDGSGGRTVHSREEEEEFFSSSSSYSEGETEEGRPLRRRRKRLREQQSSNRRRNVEDTGSGASSLCSSEEERLSGRHDDDTAEKRREQEQKLMRLRGERRKRLLRWQKEKRELTRCKRGSSRSSTSSTSSTGSVRIGKGGRGGKFAVDEEEVEEQTRGQGGAEVGETQRRKRAQQIEGERATARGDLLQKKKRSSGSQKEEEERDDDFLFYKGQGDSLLEEIIEAELRRAEKNNEREAVTPAAAPAVAGMCGCACAACSCCEKKEDSKKEEAGRKKKGTKQENKQIEELLWSIASDMAHLPAKATLTEWRRRTEAAVEIRRYDWQAGGLEAWYFLSKLRDVRAEIRVKVEEERRLEKLQENSLALASVFPYSAAALKQERPSPAAAVAQAADDGAATAYFPAATDASASPHSPFVAAACASSTAQAAATYLSATASHAYQAGCTAAAPQYLFNRASALRSAGVPADAVGPVPPATEPPPLPAAAPPPAPRASSSSTNSVARAASCSADVYPLHAAATVAAGGTGAAPSAAAYATGASFQALKEQHGTSENTASVEVLHGQHEEEQVNSEGRRFESAEKRYRLRRSCYPRRGREVQLLNKNAGQTQRAGGSPCSAPRAAGSREGTSVGKEGCSTGSNTNSSSQAAVGGIVRDKPTLPVTKPLSRTLHHAGSSGAGIRVPTSNLLVKRKMQLVEKWKRSQEREDEEERRLEEERERREQQRQLRERMKLEEWKERQIASGKAASNANLIEVKEDWRSIVEANRNQQRQ